MTRPRTSVTEPAALFNAAKQPVYVVDHQMTIVFCNEACLEWAGQAENALVGCRCVWNSSPDVPPAAAIAAALCPPPTVLCGIEITAPVTLAGEERPARFVPLRGAGAVGGDLAGVLVIVAAAAEPRTEPELALAEEPGPMEVHQQIRRFRRQAATQFRLDRLIGDSPATRRVRAQVELAIGSRASVVLVGPPGSGRQYLAHAIHYSGDPDATGALVPLACSVLAADLLQSTLRTLTANFARDPKQRRNTLLLLEVDQLPPDAQQPLAELLAASSFPLRLIATARQSPVEMAADERFRSELAALVSTLTIVLPPLAARRQDLPLLAQLFLEEGNAKRPKQLAGFTPEALDCLDDYPWPGNLDELAQVVDEAHQRAEGVLVTVADLPQRIHLAAEAAAHPRRKEDTIVLDEFLARVETELIRRALGRAKGNKAKAARLLGMTRPRLYRRMVQLGLEKPGDQAR
jgi:DNA-binding NtrC family response regulator